MSDDLNLKSIGFQNNLRSKPVRQNFTDIQNNFNALRSEFATSVSSTASEITNARDNLSALDDNIHLRSQYYGYVNTGGLVTAQSTPDNTILVSAGSGIVNGIGVDFTAATSATMSAPTTGRYDVVAINSDNTLSIESGNDSADKILPALASTQRPLAIITQDTANPLTITNSDITEIRRQGCIANGKWFFKIQDAVNYISSGEIKIYPGEYYEEIDLSGKSNIKLIGQPGVNVYRPDATSRALKSINSSGNETTGITIKDISFYGNGKAGAISNVEIDYTDEIDLIRLETDANSSSTATYKEIRITNSDKVDFLIGIGADDSNWIDTSTCSEYYLSTESLIITDRPATFNTAVAINSNTTITGNLDVTGDIEADTTIFGPAKAFLHGAGLTETQFMAPIAAAIPTAATGVEYPINGYYKNRDLVLSAVKYLGGTTYEFYGYRTTGGGLDSWQLNSTGGTLTGLGTSYSM